MTDNTKTEILNIAERLFFTKGYENTSIASILKEANIARGTLYYYFVSKEDLLDQIIDRQGQKVMSEARKIALDKSIAPEKRLILSLVAMQQEGHMEDDDLDLVHEPHNALLHQKINNYIVQNATPFLCQIVEDGIETGVFNTHFPKESVEMILIYVNNAFDHLDESNPEAIKNKIGALIDNIHRIFGAREGSLDFSLVFGGQ